MAEGIGDDDDDGNNSARIDRSRLDGDVLFKKEG
jgi:hypothetical protein